MTARKLRQILFEVDNQEMTIRQLRAALLEIQNQDKELTGATLFRIALEADEKNRRNNG